MGNGIELDPSKLDASEAKLVRESEFLEIAEAVNSEKPSYTEFQFISATDGQSSHPTAEHFDKRHSAAQKRFIRAVETLPKVRKLQAKKSNAGQSLKQLEELAN